ncbi:hypothetical protein [Streptomyces sp. NPDC102283]|uniref:hypothetical protein n=1 Tax=Streptomyces sp. NPDC102283 TaxID=3366155 RepID=UPI0037F1D1FA
MSKHTALPESELSLAALRGDCARMAPHWTAAVKSTPSPVKPPLINGVTVPPSSVRLIDAMSEYGD